MPSLSHPKALYFVRIAQLAFSLAFLVLICWSGVHRAWWTNINGALAVGVIASVLTLALTLHTIISSHLKRNPFSGGSTVRTILRLGAEIIVLLLWIAAASNMLRPKDGCGENRRHTINGEDRCFYKDLDENTYAIHSTQPLVQWHLGVAFSFVEIVSFAVTTYLVWRDDRSSKISGEVSYA